MCQVDADEVDFFLRQAGLRCLLDLLGRQGFPFGLFERLLFERFRLLFDKEPFRRLDQSLALPRRDRRPARDRTCGRARASRARGHSAQVRANRPVTLRLPGHVTPTTIHEIASPSVEGTSSTILQRYCPPRVALRHLACAPAGENRAQTANQFAATRIRQRTDFSKHAICYGSRCHA